MFLERKVVGRLDGDKVRCVQTFVSLVQLSCVTTGMNDAIFYCNSHRLPHLSSSSMFPCRGV